MVAPLSKSLYRSQLMAAVAVSKNCQSLVLWNIATTRRGTLVVVLPPNFFHAVEPITVVVIRAGSSDCRQKLTKVGILPAIRQCVCRSDAPRAENCGGRPSVSSTGPICITHAAHLGQSAILPGTAAMLSQVGAWRTSFAAPVTLRPGLAVRPSFYDSLQDMPGRPEP